MWNTKIDCTYAAGALTKNAGVVTGFNAGATSQQGASSSSTAPVLAYVDMPVYPTDFGGLVGWSTAGTFAADFNQLYSIVGPVFENDTDRFIMWNGGFQGPYITFVAGDVLRIERTPTEVVVKLNGIEKARQPLAAAPVSYFATVMNKAASKLRALTILADVPVSNPV